MTSTEKAGEVWEKLGQKVECDQERELAVAEVRLMVEKLRISGWDQAAVRYYLSQITTFFEATVSGSVPLISEFTSAYFFVGSEEYRQLLLHSELPAKAKVLLVIDQLGGYLDNQQDLVLDSAKASCQFTPALAPGSAFSQDYALLVQTAFPQGLVPKEADQKLARPQLKARYVELTKVHQFRHYLDRQHILYVKAYQQTQHLPSEEAALKQLLRRNWQYADPLYHNRAYFPPKQRPETLTSGQNLTRKGFWESLKKQGFYRKILSKDFHSEFIVDEAGNLVSQWAASGASEEAQTRGLANGESFNYGRSPLGDWQHTHDLLDGKPPRYFDFSRRLNIKRNWLAPKRSLLFQVVRWLSEHGVHFKKS